jgi:hypothetical protein
LHLLHDERARWHRAASIKSSNTLLLPRIPTTR